MQKGILSKENKIISRSVIPNVFDLTNYFLPFSLKNDYLILLFLLCIIVAENALDGENLKACFLRTSISR